jgi:hypothetical protein
MKNRVTLMVMLCVILISALPVKPAMASSGRNPGFLDVYPKQERTGYLMANKMTVLVFPLNRDYFYQYWLDRAKTLPQSVRTYELTGIELGYKDLFLAPDPDNAGGMIRYTILYHTTGSELLALGIYDRGKTDMFGNYVPTTSYYTADVKTDAGTPDTEHTVLGNYYPNKIVNDLEVAEAILDYQAANGPFVAGQEYSMLEIMDFKFRPGYVMGKTSSGNLVTGGGACVMATNWMKMITLMGAQVTQRWQHPTQMKYFENPYSGPLLGIDATDATVEWPSYDLTWIQPTTGYVKITGTVVTDGTLTNDYGEGADKFDATEIITMRFTTQKPDLSSQTMHALQQRYLAYRQSKNPSTSSLDGVNKLVAQVNWARGDKLSLFLQKIAPEERVSRFADELRTDPFLRSLATLRMTANIVGPQDPILVGGFLKTTPWYRDQINLLRNNVKQTDAFEAALRHLDYSSNLVPKQKVQCVGLVILLSGMDSRFPNIGGAQVSNAAQLVPDAIKNGSSTVVSMGNYLAMVVQTPEDVKAGDLLVRYDSPTGHIAGVVGKKVVNGKSVLLIAAANQTGEGILVLFEVDEDNFEAVFGIPAFKKVVLRKQ